MRNRTALITAALAALLASTAVVAQSPTVTLDAQEMKIDQAAAELSKQTGIQVVCDTGISATVNGSFSGIELEKLLDIIVKPNNLKWQKLYLKVQDEQKPTIQQIKAQADALAALNDTPLVVYDPATGKQSVFIRQTADAPTVSPEQLGLKPLYFISSTAKNVEKTAASGDDTLQQYMKLSEERQKLFNQMTPEQRQTAYQQEMLAQIQMDPQARAQMMRDQWAARRNMPDNIRDQYRQVMRDTFRELRNQGAMPDMRRGDRGDRGNWGGRGNRGERR